jgi:Sulfite exporter TauE/SafE
MHAIDPLYSVCGFVGGLLVGVTGVGGGSLMTPLLILLFGVHPATAVGTDLSDRPRKTKLKVSAVAVPMLGHSSCALARVARRQSLRRRDRGQHRVQQSAPVLGLTYWSLSKWAKLKVKNAVNFIGEFERTLAAEAHRHGVGGIICGHIHHATIQETSGVRYINCGDWVESCTAVAEHSDGRLEIITWTAVKRAVGTAPLGRRVRAA